MFKGQQSNEVVKETLDEEKVPYMVVDNGGVLKLHAVHRQKLITLILCIAPNKTNRKSRANANFWRYHTCLKNLVQNTSYWAVRRLKLLREVCIPRKVRWCTQHTQTSIF